MAVNKVILVGNVGKDPEVRYLDNNTPVARFSLATSESYTNKNGEKVDQTEWHNIVVWRGLAKVVESYVRKGRQVYIEGRIRTRQWQDKDGNTRYTTEINADNLQLLGRRNEGDAGDAAPPLSSYNEPPQGNTNTSAAEGAPEVEDDLPF